MMYCYWLNYPTVYLQYNSVKKNLNAGLFIFIFLHRGIVDWVQVWILLFLLQFSINSRVYNGSWKVSIVRTRPNTITALNDRQTEGQTEGRGLGGVLNGKIRGQIESPLLFKVSSGFHFINSTYFTCTGRNFH